MRKIAFICDANFFNILFKKIKLEYIDPTTTKSFLIALGTIGIWGNNMNYKAGI